MIVALVLAALALTTVNYLGVEKTAGLTRVIVALVLAALAVVVTAVWVGGSTELGRLWPLSGTSAYGVLQSAGFLFFAFAGYARIATLGEEVIDPRRTIPRAIPIALGITLVIYAAVALSVLAGLGAPAVAAAPVPLAAAVEAGDLAQLSPLVRVGAAIASLGVLLSLIAGVSRTVFAMASNHDLPAYFASVHPRHRVPHRADLAIGALVTAAIMLADLRTAIGFSSFAVLTYYGIANACALTLERAERRWPKLFSGLGVLGCVTLALSLPLASIAGGLATLAVGAVLYWWRATTRPA